MEMLRSNNHKVELLAPACNLLGFYGVMAAGADAVYLAGNRFGARAYADNFSEEDIITALSFAHHYGKKIYLTVNTLVRDDEMNDVISMVEPLYRAGLDGVIVQDYGVIQRLQDAFPKLSLHASTQMTITSVEGALFAKSKGIRRIVPARELSLEEMLSIKDATGLEIESFIHGAMCYSYSGQCLFSSCIGGRSGNRGRCAQPCRLPYRFEMDSDAEAYPLSLKDMNTIDILEDLLRAGIDSFKIEGRMKRPEYAAGVTAIYRKAIDCFYEEGTIRLSKEDIGILDNLYVRTQTENGYYFRQNGSEMITLKNPAYKATPDSLCASIRAEFLDSIHNHFTTSIPVYASVVCIKDQPISITYSCTLLGNTSCVGYAEGDFPEQAKKAPVTEENIIKQICKLGDTCFTTKDYTVTLEDSLFVPLKVLGDVRREAIHNLSLEVLAAYGYSERIPEIGSALLETTCDKASDSVHAKKQSLAVQLLTAEQLRAVKKCISSGKCNTPISDIYVELQLLQTCPEVLSDLKYISDFSDVYLGLPGIPRKHSSYYKKVEQYLKENTFIKGVLVRCTEDYEWIQTLCIGRTLSYVTDHKLYCYNSDTVRLLFEKKSTPERITLPLELSAGQMHQLIRETNRNTSGNYYFEKMIYGRIPLMTSANCIRKTHKRCIAGNRTSWETLKDRKGNDIPVLIDCINCRNQIFNTVPLSLHKSISKWGEVAAFRLSFTNETKEETFDILSFYMDVLCGKAIKNPSFSYTTGYEKEGVE